ncbi:Uncharacterised protein [Cedecea neteri]|uniref:Uncharacterized protein n=1 Tax=Cedecea neteri TaxID=158822 RepID=A0A2X3II11_9ENTR|nr:Uncharacterised protein [Cedecea neteri]
MIHKSRNDQVFQTSSIGEKLFPASQMPQISIPEYSHIIFSEL